MADWGDAAEDAYYEACQNDPKKLPKPEGPCPFCGSTKGSLPVDYGMSGWRCNGCGKWLNGPSVEPIEGARACVAFMCLKPRAPGLGGVCGKCGASGEVVADLWCAVCDTNTLELIESVKDAAGNFPPWRVECTKCRGVWFLTEVTFCECPTIGEMRVRRSVYHCATCNLRVPDPNDETKGSRWRKSDGPAVCADCLSPWTSNRHVCSPYAMDAKAESYTEVRSIEVTRGISGEVLRVDLGKPRRIPLP
jgi:hypothetical protein